MPVIIPFVVPVKNKFIAYIKAGAFSAIRNSTILCLKFRKQFLINYRHFTPIFHCLFLQIPTCGDGEG